MNVKFFTYINVNAFTYYINVKGFTYKCEMLCM